MTTPICLHFVSAKYDVDKSNAIIIAVAKSGAFGF